MNETSTNPNRAQDANKKYYFALVPASERNGVYVELFNEKAELQIWAKGEEKKVETYEVVEYQETSNHLIFKSKGSLISFFSKSPLVERKIFVKAQLKKFVYFTTATLEYDKATDLYAIETTNDLYRSQRRSDYRLTANRYNTLRFKLDGVVFDCIDVSSGGTSFWIPPNDKERFAKGKEFKDCILHFDKINYQIPRAKIAASWEKKDETTGTVKIGVGVQFLDMPDDTDVKLCQHVNTEARAEEIRKSLQPKEKK